jgi:tRNA (guanine-N7-)-methyltransferase
MNATTPIRKPRGAFFGRRKGHPLRAGQASLIQGLLPDLALDLSQPAPLDASAFFKTSMDSLRLEIGFGGGEHLLHEAR